MEKLIEVKILFRTGRSKQKRKPAIVSVPIGFTYKILREIISSKIDRRTSGIHIKSVEILTTTN